MFRIVLIGILLAGCAPATDQRSALDLLGRTVKPAAVDLSGFQAPQGIAGFRLQGEIASEDGDIRMWRYVDDRSRVLEVTIYPLPGGWETYTAERAVAGHFGQLRHQQLERLQRRGASPVRVAREALPGPDGTPPVAEALLEASFDQPHPYHRLLFLTLAGEIFVRMTVDPVAASDAPALREAFVGLAGRWRRPAPEPHPDER